MVRINKIYTRTGDDGSTGLVDGSRVPKDSLRVTAYGDIDELNANLGAVRSELGNWSELDTKIENIQQELFDIGGQLATPANFTQYPVYKVEPSLIERLEQWIDAAIDPLPPLTSFVLPSGSRLNAELHRARTVCRRAERSLIALATQEPIDPPTLTYLNRLSDLLFAWCRAESFRANRPEFLWVPAHKRKTP
jgi:cob(I)alamin adenosyltransferase